MSHHSVHRLRTKALQRRKQKQARRQEWDQVRQQDLWEGFGSGSLEENMQRLEDFILEEQRVRDGWIGTMLQRKTAFLVKGSRHGYDQERASGNE